MFTGIIQELGTVARVERRKGIVRLTVHAPKTAARVGPMESVSVSGTCLTAVDVRGGTIGFEMIPETQSGTALGRLKPGGRVHIEPSLSLADRLGGHILLGHVDGVGTIVKRRQRAGELMLEIRVPAAVRRYLVPKGPVAVDGVSLTVGKTLGASTFSIHLIPETLRRTTLRDRRPGDRVNVEADYLAKLIWQFTSNGKRH
jgi:riboflavin synthase